MAFTTARQASRVADLEVPARELDQSMREKSVAIRPTGPATSTDGNVIQVSLSPKDLANRPNIYIHCLTKGSRRWLTGVQTLELVKTIEACTEPCADRTLHNDHAHTLGNLQEDWVQV